MAPETRSKKLAASATPARKQAKTTAPVTKRKAIEDASPVAVKKAKSVKADDVAKKTAKASKPAPRSQKPEEQIPLDDQDSSSDEGEDRALVLAGIEDSDGEGEIENDSAAFKEGQDVGTIPDTASKAVQQAKAHKKDGEDAGVVYVGRIPHGFYEHEMKQYFEQFGKITRLRLSRNKHTGASKHYAFIEFAEKSTAEIVSKTMDNYLLFGHILKTKLLSDSQVHENLWKGANKRFKSIPRNKLEGNKLKKPLSESQWANKISRENKRRADKAKKLKDMGYEFEAPELKNAVVAHEGAKALESSEETPKAIEAPAAAESKAPEVGIGDGVESLDGDLAVKKPTATSARKGAKTGRKTKTAPKAKKSKA